MSKRKYSVTLDIEVESDEEVPVEALESDIQTLVSMEMSDALMNTLDYTVSAFDVVVDKR